MDKCISVIVPAYNAEKTIDSCLKSILNQSYSNLEVIVINDGSQDKTESLVREWMVRDSRVKLCNIPNGGVSNARNIGIDMATGDYITFVDSDDTIEQEMYKCLIELIKKYDADVTHCSYNTVFDDGKIVPVGDNGKEILQTTDEAIECLISGKFFASGLCNKLYRKELFDGVRLDKNIKFNEDGLMNFFLFRKAKKIVYTDKPFYNYYQNGTSATHTANRLKTATDGALVSSVIYENSRGYNYEKCALRRLAVSKLGLYGEYRWNKGTVLKSEIKELETEVIHYKEKGIYSRNELIKVFMYKYIPGVYKCCYTVYDRIRVKRLDPEQ